MDTVSRLAYRPDIDGLRALAVLSVIGFHAFPGYVRGGFIGVDIFFVISGYLITGILLREQAAGRFGIVRFYQRRIQRIFPALTLVLFACLSFGWFALLAEEYARLGRHTAAGAGFIANLAYWSEAGYFDTASILKPLLHLWSLGIEEQFYIAWPALLLLVWRSRLPLAITLSAAIAASFGLAVVGVATNPVMAFYSPLPRAWELLAGAALAARPASSPARPVKANLLAIIGLLTLVSGIVGMNKELPFPGSWALVPVLGTLLIVAAGDAAWINRHLLGSRPAVWIGLISYPLYLWHWPLLSYATILESGEVPRGYRIAAVILSLLLAWATYRLVELPVRTSRRPRMTALLLACMACLGSAGYAIHALDGVPTRFAGSDIEPAELPKPTRAVTICRRSLPHADYKNNICRHTATPHLAIIGDSHAGHLFEGFLRSDDDVFSQVMVMGRGACPPVLGIESQPGCLAIIETAVAIIEATPSIETVLLSAYYASEFPNAPKDDRTSQERLFLAGYGAMIERLTRSGRRVYFVEDVPTLDFNPEMCMKRPLRLPYSNHGQCQIAFERVQKQRANYDRLISELAARNPTLSILRTRDFFCDREVCRAKVDGNLMYKDFNHLTKAGSIHLARRLIPQLRSH
jgi:peptidoglycan/LPS O-acetylase OafA/YrhL